MKLLTSISVPLTSRALLRRKKLDDVTAHWESIAATDFFTVEGLTLHGLVTYYVLFVLDLASRR